MTPEKKLRELGIDLGTVSAPVANYGSDLLVEVFGEAGRHARSAVGMGSLPMGIPVEIEAIVEVKKQGQTTFPGRKRRKKR